MVLEVSLAVSVATTTLLYVQHIKDKRRMEICRTMLRRMRDRIQQALKANAPEAALEITMADIIDDLSNR